MNWLTKQWKKLSSLASCSQERGNNKQNAEEVTQETEPKKDECPSNQELKDMRMPELRSLAASRNLGAGGFKGVDRRAITKLIKESY
jgi:hypothetical protein